ncbi:MAG: para-nitrobenzyl esterase, partial [Frankiales bacterium]|nr:para-nitrobenzyl esterase [Frankiales bacterium]
TRAAAVVCLLLPVSNRSAAVAHPGLVVATTAGAVQGVTVDGQNQWRGVPYAAPPTGDRRWRPPAPAIPWAGTRDATSFAPPCPFLASQPEGAEDCLFVDISAPSTSGGARLPVMVHLHGGANWYYTPYNNTSAFVSRGVIVVNVHYRLGALGFVGHPALSAENGGSSGEYGVLDQLAALHWVHDNIAAFGGDPANVTLFGESAGSFDAVALAASPLGRGLISKLAAQTESFYAARGAGRINDAEQLGVGLADRLGCSSAPDVIACLRAKPVQDVVEAGGFEDVAPWTGGRVLPRSPLELFASDPLRIPLLLGSNREEAAFFLPPQEPGEKYSTNLWVRDTNGLVGPQNGRRARSLYPSSDFDSAYWATIGLITDAVYTCPMRRVALGGRGPVFRYLYTHRYENDPQLASFRAAHFLDDPVLWHDGSLLGGYTFTPGEDLLAGRMATYWTDFAKTGDPNGPGVPTWPAYTAETERSTVLDVASGEVSGYHVAGCGFLDSLPDIFAPAPAYTPSRRGMR